MRVRLLITGTRRGWPEEDLQAALREHYADLCERFGTEIVTLVHGDADGVDRQARDIWIGHGLPHEPHPADWERFGKIAGPRRNQRMVDLGAQQCIAFFAPTSVGTADCAKRALSAGIPVRSYLLPRVPIGEKVTEVPGQMALFEGDK